MPDNIENKTAKFTYHTDERDRLKEIAKKYKCSPFSGDCWVQEASLYKKDKLYHIILTEQQMNEFGEDFIIEPEEKQEPNSKARGWSTHRALLMIKPTEEDNNYIFFRRK